MKRFYLNIISIFLLNLLLAIEVQAATYYVATTGNDSNSGTQSQPFRTLAKGIATGANGDTIAVADGTYNEHDLDFGAKNLTLTSQSGNPATCILDCQGLGQGIRINGGQAAATVAGLTIRNAVTPSNHTGGGMNIARSGAAVTNCVFSSCKYGLQNGLGADALYLDSAPSVTITGCTFSGNGAGASTGALVSTSAVNSSNVPTLADCVFTGNSAGAVSILGGSLNLTHCTFTNNQDTFGGAGIYLGGGAVAADRCVFTGNHCNNDGGNFFGGGGGIYVGGGGMTLTNSLLTGNTSTSGGDKTDCQILVEGTSPMSMKLVNCTLITANSTDIRSNIEVFCPPFSDGSDNLTVVNSIIRGAYVAPEISLNGGALATVTYSNVGSAPDPLFINPAAGNYRLQSTSPCINTGNAAALNLPATDLDGAPRILGGAPDIGAYETWNPAYGTWFVDKALGSDTTGIGSPTAPFKTVVKAINTASNGHKIYIKAGNYGTDKPRITKALRLFNWLGTGQARIGKP